MTREQEVFILADLALCDVVDEIEDDQWSMPLPDWFQIWGKTEDLRLRDVINYHAYDDAWVPDVLAGKTKAEVGATHDGDLLGEDPKHSFRGIAARAVETVKALDDLDRNVHLSYGDFPAREYLKHITSFRGLRVHDISRMIGAGGKMPDNLVQGLWDVVAPQAEEWRQMGVFGLEIPAPEGADQQTRLLCLLGREG